MFRNLVVMALLCGIVARCQEDDIPVIGIVEAGDSVPFRAAIGSQIAIKAVSLAPGTTYEFRVSYLGSPPLKVSLTARKSSRSFFHTKPQIMDSAGPLKVDSTRRQTLDTEKIFLSHMQHVEYFPNEEKKVEDDVLTGEAIVDIRVDPGGRERVQFPVRFEAHFVVTVEELLFGVIPQSALLLACVIVLLLLFTYFFFLPAITREVDVLANAKDRQA